MKKVFLFSFVLLITLVGIPGISFAQQIYTVQPGDSLWVIGVRYRVGISDLIAANRQFSNPNLIYPGQKVNIPSFDATMSIEDQVIILTNQERARYGLKPLIANGELSKVAIYKSNDMKDKDYFSHISPTYGDHFKMMKNFGIAYRVAGENIAAGQATPQSVVQAWMNNPRHRKNILNGNFTQIGVGCSKGGSHRYYWTQLFISK